MADQASDFMRQAQAMAQQSWEQWMRNLQQASPQAASTPFGGMGAGFGSAMPPGMPMGDVLERSLGGIKGYMDWMQRAVGAQVDPTGSDWQAQMQQLFGNIGQPFSQAFGGIDSTAAQGFVQQWQAWLAAAGQGGAGNEWFKPVRTPAFGLQREQQEKQQALMAAMLDSAEQQRRYQALILRANAQGLERLQDKLAAHSEPGRQIESLKALYDLWIDSAEEAYAEIALGDEFREVYGAMVNAQMLERQLMQQQLEELCRQLGLPTRSEVDSLGKRLQEVRREQRAAGGGSNGDIEGLRAELAALKKQLASMRTSVSASSGNAAKDAGAARARPAAAVRKRPAGKPASSSSKAAPAKPSVAAAKKAPAKAKAKATKSKSKSKSSKLEASRPTAGKATAVLPGIPAPRRGKRT